MGDSHLRYAHAYGVSQALNSIGYKTAQEVINAAVELGLVKTALSPGAAGMLGDLAGRAIGSRLGMPNSDLLHFATGPLAAGLAADEGKGMGAAAGQLLGSAGGGLAGSYGGALAGKHIAPNLPFAGTVDPYSSGLGGSTVGSLAGSLMGGYGLANRWGT